jgi:hypothetical protein
MTHARYKPRMMKTIPNRWHLTALNESDRPGRKLKTKNSDKSKTVAPLKICIAFDKEASARSAEVIIKHVASDIECETQSFQFDELQRTAQCVAAARTGSIVEVLVLAVRDDRMLPAYVQSWLGLWLGFRDEEANGTLVVLVPKAVDEPDPDASLWDYLETLTAIGGLSLFAQYRSTSRKLSENQWSLLGLGVLAAGSLRPRPQPGT